MGFEGLLGNQQLKDNLIHSISRGKLSHFYLICGPEGSGKHTLARLLSAAAVCQGDNKPCLSCRACRKVMADTHPDVITVTDPDHKTVPVKLVRQIRDNMFIRPNEADRKLYLFPQELGLEGYNALLKVLEEPPSYGIFLLMTDNPEKILPTVRSRCTELKLRALPEDILHQALLARFPQADSQTLQAVTEQSGGYLGQALALLSEGAEEDPHTRQFLQYFAQRDTMGLLKVLVPMERWKRDQLITVLARWKKLLHQALLCRSGMPTLSEGARLLATNRSAEELLQAIQHIQRTIEYAQGNVSVAAICGFLTWALR